MISRFESMVSMLRTDPLGFLVYAVYLCVTVLLSLILHEMAHGYVALRCGDPTAKMMGRLSFDPRKHLDPIGTVCMVFLGFGWAKPVPVNPRNFRNGRRDDFFVSIAGIVTNLTLFILCTLLSVLVNQLMWQPDFLSAFKDYYGTVEYLVSPYYQIGNDVMNGTMDASFAEALRFPWLQYVQRFLLMLGQINLSLAVFNLMPIPPLDGYHLVNDTLLKGRLQLSRQWFMICQAVLLVLCFTGIFSSVLSWACTGIYDAVLNLFLLMTGGV